MFSRIQESNARFFPLTIFGQSSMKNNAMKDKQQGKMYINKEVGLLVQQHHGLLFQQQSQNKNYKIMKPVFSFNQQKKDEKTSKNKTDDNDCNNPPGDLINENKDQKTTKIIPLNSLQNNEVQTFYQGKSKNNKGKIIYRRKITTTSYGRHQQRLQQRRHRKYLQEINFSNISGANNQAHNISSSCHCRNQHGERHHHHHHRYDHQHHLKIDRKFFVAKSLLGEPQKLFQERVQRRQAALFFYRQWQIQVRQEFEELEKIQQNMTLPSESVRKSAMMKKEEGGGGNMAVVRPIRMGFQKMVRCPSIIRDRKKGEVKTSELKQYFNLLETDIVSRFLERDSCYRLSDRYLLAAAFVYFKRAGYVLEKYIPRNFFVSLYLANDMEEDEEDLKYEIFPWAIGSDWPNRIQEFLKERDRLFQEINQRGVVSRICCEEVMAIIPTSKFWLRNRLLHHAGGARNTTVLINPTLDCNSSNVPPQIQTNNNDNSNNNISHKFWLNYCGIIEPIQPFLLSPDIPPVTCFLCNPELAPTPPKNFPPLSLVLRQNPAIQGCQIQQKDPQNTKVVRCFASRSDSDFTSSSDEDNNNDDDDELLSYSDSSSFLD